jgi:hypothetical protein
MTVLENRVLRRIFEPKRDEVTGEWRKLHNEEVNALYSLPTIVQVMELRRISWAGHLACIGRRQVFTGFWLENLRERDDWIDPSADGE